MTFTCKHCGKRARTVSNRNCLVSPTMRHEREIPRSAIYDTDHAQCTDCADHYLISEGHKCAASS